MRQSFCCWDKEAEFGEVASQHQQMMASDMIGV
jgi:hypothetical protein